MRVVPVFGEDPEMRREHFILAVCHGYTVLVSEWIAMEKEGPEKQTMSGYASGQTSKLQILNPFPEDVRNNGEISYNNNKFQVTSDIINFIQSKCWKKCHIFFRLPHFLLIMLIHVTVHISCMYFFLGGGEFRANLS